MNKDTKYRRFGILTRMREYILRIGKARGFGIQSPWAFSFVTEVIGERLPYYAYTDIDRMCKNRSERRFQKLMLRIRNFVHPNQVIIIGDIITLEDSEAVGALISSIGSGGCIVIRDIWNDTETINLWHGLQQREDVGVTFDLYDFGICFLDTKIFKQHYRLNF